MPEAALAQARKQAETRLDITTLKTGDIIEGRYKYIDRIGRGAFGTVLLMEDTVVDERLILKFLNPNVSEDEEVMKRFVHELRYSRKITHKNVIRIYDFLYIQGLYAISMEYFPSHTLGGEIVNEKPMELRRALRFGCDIATGMTVAHQVGIVHRDLKPANLLINQDGLLKIVDFGVAAAHREGDTQLTKTGYVIGSPKYMAPEQILGKKVDERADIYAEGVILYEMLTGVPPYARGDHMSVKYQHVQGRARPPSEINSALPPGLSDAVMKAMAVGQEQALPVHGRVAHRTGIVHVGSGGPGRPSGPHNGLSSCVTSTFLMQAIDFVAQSWQNHWVGSALALSGGVSFGAHRRVPETRHAAGLFGCAPGGGRPAHAAHAWRSAAHQVRDLRAVELEGYVTEILTRSQAEHFATGSDLDFSYVSADGGRFRVNVFRKDTGVGATFRAIPTDVPSLEKLALPPIVTKLCDYHQGMILVTGSTGTGKSTTLAAMIDHLNHTRKLNIISLEDPIEFVHRSKNSQVIQRELHTHIPSFAEGVRAAMREDPDVILVGEMRDAETIRMAMTAAETGHLVLGTLHTTGAVKTIDRVIDALPGRGARTDQELPVAEPAGRHHPDPVQDHRRPRPQGDLRSDGHDPCHRQVDPDRPKPSDPDSAADGDAIWACRCSTRRCWPPLLPARSILMDAYAYASNKSLFQKFVTDTSVLPKAEFTATMALPAE